MIQKFARKTHTNRRRPVRSARRLLHELLEGRQLLAGDALGVAPEVAVAVDDEFDAVWAVGATSESILENRPGSESVLFELGGEIPEGQSVSVFLGLELDGIDEDDIENPVELVQDAVALYDGRGTLEFNPETVQLVYTGGEGGSRMTTLRVPIVTIDDDVPEESESAIVFLDGPDGATIEPNHGSQRITILDDDGLLPVWSVDATSETIAENEPGSESVIFRLRGELAEGQSASVTLGLLLEEISSDDIADPINAVLEAIDAYQGDGAIVFDPATAVLTFTAGEGGSSMSPLLVPIVTIDDGLAEGPESSVVLLGGPVGSRIDPEQSEQGVTILDDDLPIWRVSATSETIREDEPGSESVIFSLDGEFGAEVSVSVVLGLLLEGLSADDIADPINAVLAAIESYQGEGSLDLNNETAVLTYTSGAEGSSMSPLFVPIVTIDDEIPEEDESAVVLLDGAVGSRIDPNHSSQVITVLDDDRPRPVWSVRATSESIKENAPGSEAVIFSLDGALRPGESASVALGLLLEGIGPNDIADPIELMLRAVGNYDGPGELRFDPESAILTFTAVETFPVADADFLATSMTPLEVPIVTINDGLAEGQESAIVLLGESTGSRVDPEQSSQRITILDDDGLLWSLDATSERVREGDPGNEFVVLALRGELPGGDSTGVQLDLVFLEADLDDIADPIRLLQRAIDVYDGPGSLDFDIESSVLTYSAGPEGSSMAPLLVPIVTIDDDESEEPESFIVTMDNPVSSSGARVAVDAEASEQKITIIDNDVGRPIQIIDGVVTVEGSDRNDAIEVRSIRGGRYVQASIRTEGGDRIVGRYPTSEVVGVRVDANGGDDTVSIHRNLRFGAKIDGGRGNDDLTGGNRADVIIDLHGDNQIDSGLGDDKVRTGDGNDWITTGYGHDEVDAGGGRNIVRSGHGHDTIRTGDGRDLIFAGPGKDLVRAGNGDDLVVGGGGNDILLGEGGNDILLGLAGRDLIIGGPGVDVILGGASSDLLLGGSTTHDQNDAALKSISAEWGSSRTLAVRKENIIDGSGSDERLNGEFFLNRETVVDDSTLDILFDQSSSDWSIPS